MRRHRYVVFAALLLVGGCSSTAEPSAPAVDRLVVLDESGNVVTMEPDGSDRVDVTTDAGDDTAYFQPGWSPDAQRLGFSEIRDGGYSVVVTGIDGAGAARTATENLAFYLYWDPAGERLTWLRNSGIGEIALEGIEPETGEVVGITSGAPLYYAWSPDGSELVSHVGEDVIETREATGAEPEPLPELPGSFQAPDWSPAGIVYAGRGATNQPIYLFADGTIREVARVPGTASFSTSPDGRRIAILGFRADEGSVQSAAFQTAPSLPVNHLVVLDLESGESTVALGRAVAGFAWSPDSSMLAVLLPGDAAGSLRWEVWTADGTTRLAEFIPTATYLRDVLPFFDQYVKNVRLWSPDSTRIAFPGSIDGERGIWVQEVSGNPPVRVSDGIFVAWSPR